MERKINWYSGCYDEIELVYDKANENENIAATLMELETMALQEAEESCVMLKMGDTPITREMFHQMSEQDKEMVMYCLSGAGLQEFVPSMTEGKITVTFSPHIQRVLGCTMFSVLNRLEKLDGAFNVMFPKATLELRVPLGAKKGMMKCEMLIMQLYPWLSITETSTNTVSSTLNVQPQTESKTSVVEAKKIAERLLGYDVYTDPTKKAIDLMFEAQKDQLDRGGLQNVFYPFHLTAVSYTHLTLPTKA